MPAVQQGCQDVAETYLSAVSNVEGSANRMAWLLVNDVMYI